MTDVVDSATRSRMMSGIRGRNTKPELEIRSALHQRGFRFRLHSTSLPGRPDMVLAKFRAAIFVHGCFWHGHDCNYFRLPRTRREFWQRKIDENRARDARNQVLLIDKGWRVMTVWECTVRDKSTSERSNAFEELSRWIRGTHQLGELRG